MSRPLVLEPRAALVAPEPDDEAEDLQGLVKEALPSWLTSLVFHLSLVLLLALIQVLGSDGGGGNGGNSLDCSIGGPGMNDGMDTASMAMGSELPSTAELAQALPSADHNPLEMNAELPQLEVPNPLAVGNPLGTGTIGLQGSNGTGEGVSAGEGGGSGGGSGGGEGDGIGMAVKTGIFGLVDEGKSFVYVFDRSDSMNSELVFTSEGAKVFSVTPLQRAKAELVRSLDELNAKQRFHILFYNHEMWSFDTGGKARGKLVPATDRNKAGAKAFIESVLGHGNTYHVKPLETAIRMKPDVIFLLTDGEEKDDPTVQQIASLTRANEGRTKINVIQFCYQPRTQSTLIQLANENGGRHIFMSIANLAPKMQELAP